MSMRANGVDASSRVRRMLDRTEDSRGHDRTSAVRRAERLTKQAKTQEPGKESWAGDEQLRADEIIFA